MKYWALATAGEGGKVATVVVSSCHRYCASSSVLIEGEGEEGWSGNQVILLSTSSYQETRTLEGVAFSPALRVVDSSAVAATGHGCRVTPRGQGCSARVSGLGSAVPPIFCVFPPSLPRVLIREPS